MSTGDRYEVVMTAQTDEGFAVAHAGREQYGNNRALMFSCGVDVYRSKRAYEIGAEARLGYGSGGDSSGLISRYFPELVPIAAMSGAWVDTGEPMHGTANGWYRLGGADMAHEINSRTREYGAYPNYHEAPPHLVVERARLTCWPWLGDHEEIINPDFAAFFVDMAARCLRVAPDELPNVQDPDLFAEWVETVARPRWADEARAANELIDRLSERTTFQREDDAATRESSDDVSFSLGEGDTRISVRCWQPGGDFKNEACRDDVGWHYSYRVQVRACGTSYTTTYGGSVADYDAGNHDARGGCNCVLRELFDALNYETGAEWAAEMGMDEDDRSAFARLSGSLSRLIAAAERMRAALEANTDAIGG